MADRKITILGPPQVFPETPMILDPDTGEEVPASVYAERRAARMRQQQEQRKSRDLPALDLSQPPTAPRRMKPKQEGQVGDDPSNRILQAVLERMGLSGGLLS